MSVTLFQLIEVEWFKFGAAAILVIIFGIPHGATDHLASNFASSGKFSASVSFQFLLKYLSPIAVYALLWWWLPQFSLLIFLIVSAYHFGETQIMSIPKAEVRNIGLYFSWGSLLLSVLFWLNPEETRTYLREIISINSIGYIKDIAFVLLIISSLFVLIMSGWLYFKKQLTTKQLIFLIVDTLLLFVLFKYTNLLFGFAVFFGFWHSYDAILLQIQGFRKAESHFGFKDFYKYATPFTLISLVGLVLLLYLFINYELPVNLVMVFFIFISVITLPHMLTIKDFYKNVLSS